MWEKIQVNTLKVIQPLLRTKMENLFLTGIYRSGTTLLDKVLHNHPQVSIFSQPFSSLYVNVKRQFLAKKGFDIIYPIGPDFMDTSNSIKEFSDYLELHTITPTELDVVFEGIKKNKGHLAANAEEFRSSVREGKFTDVFEGLLALIHTRFPKTGVQCLGVKEILCEEFIPGLLRKNIKSIIIIRDPRDIICSLNHGNGVEFTGDIRPLLYSIRLWRKSVAYAINNKDVSDFIFLRYEDLVLDTAATLNKITSFLNISPYKKEEYCQPLKDQNESIWKGNSSFGNYDQINSGSIGKYKKLLTEATVKYIESVCFPEMKYLGYLFEYNDHDLNRIRSYKEPYLISRGNFSPDFSSNSENISMEMRRINSLKEDSTSKEEQEKLFLFPEVYKELKRTV
jgi:hypothetical protein